MVVGHHFTGVVFGNLSLHLLCTYVIMRILHPLMYIRVHVYTCACGRLRVMYTEEIITV